MLNKPSSKPSTSTPSPAVAAEPNSRVAELYGRSPQVYRDASSAVKAARLCPIRDSICDVSANRHRVANLNLDYKGIQPNEKQEILETYGDEPLPLGICSCWTKRQNEQVGKPWILCPKRLLSLERPYPIIPNEVRQLIEIPNGTRVGVWSELKFRRLEPQGDTNRFFEYTFDYLLMGLDADGHPIGVPYIIEVMTSSTRGGGLSEHMTDVLLGRPQRNLRGVVDSTYTPNYRQVFERMLGQFIAKSEIAERWGGRTIWVFQDVLLDYIEQTTDFDSRLFENQPGGNVFAEVYSLENPTSAIPSATTGLHLAHHKSLRGRARNLDHTQDYTSMLGLGFAPPLTELKEALRRGYLRNLKVEAGSWFEFVWGEERDPRSEEDKSVELTAAILRNKV